MPEQTRLQVSAQAPRAPYAPPQLVVHGSLATLTAAVGALGMLDGGMMAGMNRSGT